MTPRRWQQIRDELVSLVPLDSAARDARLETLGARDPRLAAEVAAYLAAGPPESFLASPAAPEVLPDAPAMLSSGDRIGPFEIGPLLGAGGMGQVYRPRDTRLRRDVAIKVSSARARRHRRHPGKGHGRYRGRCRSGHGLVHEPGTGPGRNGGCPDGRAAAVARVARAGP